MRHNRLLSPPRKRQRQCASSRQCGTRRLHAGLSFRRYLVACRHAGRMRIRSQADAKSLDRRVLQSLVDEKLLAQKAMADQLDKEPSVMRALERARRQILAHAAIEHAGGEIEISADEARKFYAENPNL